MVEDFREAIQITSWVRERWQNPSTLGLTLLAIFVFGFSLSYQFELTGIAENISWLECLAVIALMVLVIVGWLLSTRLPETPTDRIGILIAIDCETKKERQRLKEDFVEALRHEMMRGNHQQYVVHELSEYRSRKIESHEEDSSSPETW